MRGSVENVEVCMRGRVRRTQNERIGMRERERKREDVDDRKKNEGE